MLPAIQSALCIFAHPDDCELTCLGTIAKLCKAGVKVSVMVMTLGNRCRIHDYSHRLEKSKEVAQLVGFSVIECSLQDGKILYDIDLISMVENTIGQVTPNLVITQFPQTNGMGHQDHLTVSSAAVNAALRDKSINFILYAEPPVQNWGFTPNLFVDITDYMGLKKLAVQTHEVIVSRDYMDATSIETRARWWAHQAHPSYSAQGRYFEAFSLVEGILAI